MKSRRSQQSRGKGYSNVDRFLTNKIVLYVVSAVAFLDVFGLMITGKINSVIVFMIIALGTFMFSKNMVVVLLVPLFLVNFFIASNWIKEGFQREGFDTSALAGLMNAASSSGSSSGSASHSGSASGSASTSLSGSPPSSVSGGKVTASETFEVGRKSKDQLGGKIDYSTTIEQAYDNLNKILGDDGIKSMTSDTQRLMKQQQQLAETMQNLGPVMNQATEMLSNMKENGSMDGIQQMMDSLTSGKKSTSGSTFS